jgi:hypothetical protein
MFMRHQAPSDDRQPPGDLLIVLLLNLVTFFVDTRDAVSAWVVYATLTAALLYVLRSFHSRGPLGVILLTGGLVLYTFPYFGELLRGNHVSPIYYSLYVLAILVILQLSPQVTQASRHVTQSIWSSLTGAALLASLAGLHSWFPIFSSFYALALVFFERSCRARNPNRHVFAQLSAFYLVVIYHMVFTWTGFGRLNLLTYVMLPALILVHHRVVHIRQSLLLLVTPAAIVYGTFIRGVSEISTRTFAGDSVSHHLVLMEHIRLDASVRATDLHELWNQFVLYFLNWAPRDAWVGKPVGIGLWFVDDYIGRVGYSPEYSVSLGFWGEHLYLNRAAWLVTGMAMVVLSAVCARVLYKVSFRSVPVLLIFQANFLTLFWGGMASFGSRVWFMVLPALGYIWLERALQNLFAHPAWPRGRLPMRPVPSADHSV